MERNDAALLFKMYADQEAMKYRGSSPKLIIEDAYNMINQQAIRDKEHIKIRLGLFNKLTHILIGTLLLSFKENLTSCEVGFSFGKKYWVMASEVIRLQCLNKAYKV